MIHSQEIVKNAFIMHVLMHYPNSNVLVDEKRHKDPMIKDVDSAFLKVEKCQ